MVVQVFSQLLQLALFLIIVFLCFIPFGFLLLSSIKKDLDFLQKITLSAVCGMVLFTLIAYILAFLNLRFLMWGIPVIGLILTFKNRREFFTVKLNLNYKLFFFAVLILGIIGQVAVNAFSGLPYQEGLYFYSSHGHDGVWHLSLMEHLHKNVFPFINPEFNGARLQNYHFFVDLLMSEFSRLFPLFTNLDIYFRFMPTVFSLLMGLAAFIFVKEWGKKEIAGIWAMIFTYFAGSFGYLLYIPTHKSLGGESIFWVSQTQSVLGNPPHAAAFIIVTVCLFTLLKYFQTRQKTFFWISVLLGGAVIEFKVYGGMLILGGLLLVSLYELIFKRIYQTALLFVAMFILAFAIYFPNSANSQDFLIFQPWWFIRTMVVAPDRLNWLDLELRRQTYIAESNWKRVIQLEATAFLIFLFGNLGMRFLGFWAIGKQIKDNIFKNTFNLMFLSIIIASFFIPVFFLQQGVAWNTIQFNQYFLLLFGFLSALVMADLSAFIKKIPLKIFFGLIVIILAVPTQLGLLMQFYSNLPLSKITYEELDAMQFIKNNSTDEDIILTAPFNPYIRSKYNRPPIPIYSWYDTGYVAAFSSRKAFLSDEEQITIMGYKPDELFKEREMIFQTDDPKIINNYLTKNSIDYIYLVWGQKFIADEKLINADLVFENKDAKVYKVRK